MKKSFEDSLYKKYHNLELLARQVVEGFITGLHKSPFHGFSVEFAEHRTYNSGDSTKNIDWKLYGRTDKLFVKKFEEETNLRCQILIDQSSSMLFPAYENKKEYSKLFFSIQSAAVLIHLLKKQRDAVGLSAFTDHLDIHTPARSNSVHNKLLFNYLDGMADLEKQHLNKKSDPAAILHQIADKIHKRSLVVIFSDMMSTSRKPQDIYDALQHLKHNKHEVILFHVYDRDHEYKFEYDNRPYRFIDMETADEMKINPAEFEDKYRSSVSRYFNEIKVKCMQFQIDFVEAPVQSGFENILLSFFRKRSKYF